MNWSVECRRVYLGYGLQEVLRDVSVRIVPGRIYILVGPNGSGKTTLLRCIAGLKAPSRGEVRRVPALVPVGWLGHDVPVYPDWTAHQYFQWLHYTFAPDRTPWPLPEDPLLRVFWHEPLRHFSRGMLQRFFLICLDRWSPPLVCMDEPLTGLDDDAVVWCVRLMDRWRRRGQAVVFSSHRPVTQVSVDEVWYLQNGIVTVEASRRGEAGHVA